jgi:microcystin-dependent protein
MSQYSLAVSWSGKDALPDSNTNKIISGGDFNTEFSAVQTAVNSKADLNGSASESFSATTAAASTNTTQVATTAFVQTATSAANIADVVYPVGAIFTTVTAYANSAAVVTAIGGTTWVAFGAGKVLVGLDAADTDFDTSGSSTGSAGSGGSKTHTLTTAEIPAHKHGSNLRIGGGSDVLADTSLLTTVASGDQLDHENTSTTNSTDTSEVGGGGAHNNVQPYITVYFWKREA